MKSKGEKEEPAQTEKKKGGEGQERRRGRESGKHGATLVSKKGRKVPSLQETSRDAFRIRCDKEKKAQKLKGEGYLGLSSQEENPDVPSQGRKRKPSYSARSKEEKTFKSTRNAPKEEVRQLKKSGGGNREPDSPFSKKNTLRKVLLKPPFRRREKSAEKRRPAGGEN